MILPRPLTAEERLLAGKIYCRYSGINALACSSSGAAVQTLLAIAFGISTAWVSVIGPMQYLSYLFLPLGFFFAGRLGAGCNVRNFTWGSAVVCLLIASSALLPPSSGRTLLFFAGLFLLYFCSSCSASMMFPLQKNITTEGTVSRLLSSVQMISASVGLVTTLLIAFLLAKWENSVVLPLLFCAASGLFFLSGRTMSKIPEPSVLKEMAAKPVLPQVILAWKNPVVRKQLGTGFILNLALAVMVSVNMVAAKNGCGIHDTQSIFLTAIQLLSVMGSSFLFRSFTGRFGPRKMMIVSYPLLWVLALYWSLVPYHGCSMSLLIVPFVLGGMTTLFLSTSLNAYFAISVPNEIQIGGTFLVFTVTGGLVGITGSVVNPLLFRITGSFPSSDPMTSFRIFFLVVCLLSVPGILSPILLPAEKRK